MNSRRLSHSVALVALIGILAVLTTSSHAQQQAPTPFVPGEVIVQFKAGVSEAQKSSVLNAHSATTKTSYELVRIQTVTVPSIADPNALARAFAVHPEVQAAQPNYIRQTTSVGSPNDPHYVNGLMYGLSRISAPLAWSSFGAGAQTVIVADIDTGVDYTHPDLAANMWVNPGEIAGNLIDDDSNGYVDDIYGIDAGNNDSNPIDDHGHGTHTAGTFGAVSDNGIGIAGVAKNVKILACKFIRANGFGSDADAIECFNYVIAMKQRGNNIRITSNSWGSARDGGADAGPLKNAIDAAGAAGIINIFAAGNDNTDNDAAPFDPASFTSPSIVSVAASDQNDSRAGFSNYGATSVDLAAPGVSTLSTYGGGYAYLSGTSMATPHVAGAAAFLLSHRPALTVAEIKDALLNSVDVLGSWNGLVAKNGRLNVFQAVNIAPGGGGGGLVNVAAATAGATASASSSYSGSFAPGGANNGDRLGTNWGNGGGWNDATANTFPDWLQVDFNGSKTISEIDVFTVQDAYWAPSPPTAAMTFTSYGVRDFEVQYWNGAWQTIPGTVVTGNNLVWRHLTFGAVTTTRIRVVVNQGLGGHSRLAEVEAWGTNAVGGNNPPTVTLTAPGNGATFVAPASTTLEASANDNDGTVSSVTFYANGSPIGSDATSPYALNWSGVSVGNYTLTAVALDDDGATTTSTSVAVTVTPPGGALTNVAAVSAGATASASSSYSGSFAPGGANNGDRLGTNWGTGGGWNDATANTFPDWLQVDFNGSKTISEIDVFTVQDAYWAPSPPTAAMTFTSYGVRDFEVQYWNGAWQTIPGTVVTGNNLVWRHLTFGAVTTTRIRVVVNQGLGGHSRLAEVEAWGTNAVGGNNPPTVTLTAPGNGATFVAPASTTLEASANDNDGTVSSVTFYANGSPIGSDATSPYALNWSGVSVGNYTLTAVALDDDGATTTSTSVAVTVTPPGGALTNVAAVSAGATASASSSYSGSFAPGGANNGDRLGTNWGNGGGWNDATANTFPDWLQVDFNGSKTISEIDVFTVQDAYWAPNAPTATMTFTQYGLRDFEVQYWTGAAWQTIPGTVITSNNLVWRHLSFDAITTTRIRIVVNQALGSYSRITEVEAWGN